MKYPTHECLFYILFSSKPGTGWMHSHSIFTHQDFCVYEAQGSNAGGNGVKTELHVLRKGQ